MGAIEVSGVAWARPGGAPLFAGVSFSVREGERAALVGPNGVGKTTLLRLAAGDLGGHTGTVRVHGRAGYLPQLVGTHADAGTVRTLLLSLAPPAIRATGERLRAAEDELHARPGDSAAGLRAAEAVTAWAEAGGYELEVVWDAAATTALKAGFWDVADRPIGTLSGGEQKRLALEVLLRSDADVLLLDEPDNFLDVAGKRWLEAQLRATPKTVLYVSHDRELLAATATKIVTVEADGAWAHGGSFASYAGARSARLDRLDEQHRLHQRERARLQAIVKEMKRRASFADNFAPKAKAAESRLRHFDEAGAPPPPPKAQSLDVRLAGGRTGKRAITMEGLSLSGLTDPFDAEVLFGERVAVVGPNGTGKSHLLRLLAGQDVAHEGRWALGARVVPGWFRQTHDHPELLGRRLVEVLLGEGLARGPAMAALRRYELAGAAERPFETLSGGQQARFQVLLLELGGATLLLLDEPTDNLDLASAEALEEGLAGFEGTVLAVSHDRWFLRGFDRFLVFGADCSVVESLTPPLEVG